MKNKAVRIFYLSLSVFFYVIYKEENLSVQLSYWALIISLGYICHFVVLIKQQLPLTVKHKSLFGLSLVSLIIAVPFLLFTFFVRYQATCIGGNGSKCYALARESARKAVPVAFGSSYEEDVAHYLELACRYDVYEACADLIKNFENKIEVERIRDAFRSAVKYNKADLYHFARFELRQKNNIVAEKMAKESCEVLKNNNGCMLWGSLLVEKDEKQKGLQILDSACNATSDDACNLLFAYYKENNSREESLKYLARSCHLLSQKACDLLRGEEDKDRKQN